MLSAYSFTRRFFRSAAAVILRAAVGSSYCPPRAGERGLRASFVHRMPRNGQCGARPRLEWQRQSNEPGGSNERRPDCAIGSSWQVVAGSRSALWASDQGHCFVRCAEAATSFLAFSFSFHSTFVWDAHTEAHHRDADPNIVKTDPRVFLTHRLELLLALLSRTDLSRR